MQPTYTIVTSGTDPANKLQILENTVEVNSKPIGSIEDIQARIAAYPAKIQELQDAQAADEALLDSLTAILTAAGVSDITAPMTTDLNAAVEQQNETANATTLQVQADTISTQISPAKSLSANQVRVQ